MSAEASLIRQLEQIYLPVIQAETGQSLAEAREIFNGVIEKAKAESKAKGMANVDASTLLSRAATGAKLQAELELKRQEGVREEDFHWWWDMPDLERQVLSKWTLFTGWAFIAPCGPREPQRKRHSAL